ncbi:hypothetical protein ACFLZ7_01555 [Nanoarchaeota archaeon]
MKKPTTTGTCLTALGMLVAPNLANAQEHKLFPTAIEISDKEYAIYETSQEDGERQLLELSKRHDREDAWIFKDGVNPIWIDVGGKNKTKEAKTEEGYRMQASVQTVLEDMLFQKKEDVITLYHTHPLITKKFLERSLPFEAPTIDDFILLFKDTKVMRKLLPSSQFPSFRDYASCASKKVDMRRLPNVRLKPSRIVGPLLTVSYDVDNPIDGLEEALDAMNEKYSEVYSKKHGLKEMAEMYVRDAKKLGIKLEIISFNYSEDNIATKEYKDGRKVFMQSLDGNPKIILYDENNKRIEELEWGGSELLQNSD